MDLWTNDWLKDSPKLQTHLSYHIPTESFEKITVYKHVWQGLKLLWKAIRLIWVLVPHCTYYRSSLQSFFLRHNSLLSLGWFWVFQCLAAYNSHFKGIHLSMSFFTFPGSLPRLFLVPSGGGFAASTFRCHLVAAVLPDQRVPKGFNGFTHLSHPSRRVRPVRSHGVFLMATVGFGQIWGQRFVRSFWITWITKLTALWFKHSLSSPKQRPILTSVSVREIRQCYAIVLCILQFWTLSLSKMNPRWHFLLTLWRNGAKKW